MDFYNGLRVLISMDIERFINTAIFFSKMILTSLIPIRSRYKCLFSHTSVSRIASFHPHCAGHKMIVYIFVSQVERIVYIYWSSHKYFVFHECLFIPFVIVNSFSYEFVEAELHLHLVLHIC